MLAAMLALLFSWQAPDSAKPATPPVDPTPAKAEGLVRADGVEVLDLGNGCRIQGRVLRTTEQLLFVEAGEQGGAGFEAVAGSRKRAGTSTGIPKGLADEHAGALFGEGQSGAKASEAGTDHEGIEGFSGVHG